MESTETASSTKIGESSGNDMRSELTPPDLAPEAQIKPSSDASRNASDTVFPSAGCNSAGTPGSSRNEGEGTTAGQPPPPTYVYALGRIEPRFPKLALEKEFAQVMARMNLAGKNDREVRHAILSARENHYLARQMCWVFSVEGMDTYILAPREPADLHLLVETIRPRPRAEDVDIVIGMKGPIASPETCKGLMVPFVATDQIYSFDVEALVKSIPRPQKMEEKQFEAAAEELFMRIMQMADNAGATDEHRAFNYLAVRYPAVYATTAEQFARNFSLAAVEARPSRLSGTRKILDVIFSYVNRDTDVLEKYFVRVDVTEEFPFLVSKMTSYYDR